MTNTRRVARGLVAVLTPTLLLWGAAASNASGTDRIVTVTDTGNLTPWTYEPACPAGFESGDVLVHVYQRDELVGTATSGFDCGQSAFIAVEDAGFKPGRATVEYQLRFYDEPTLASEDVTVTETVRLRKG